MNIKDMIKTSVMENYLSDISVSKIVIVLTVTVVLAIYIFLVYRVAVKNEFYSKDYNRTLVLMAIVTAGIVLAVQSNLVISLGMVGALSIVRYRTAIKNAIDLFFLFWSISVGIICGAGLYLLAVAVCVAVTLVLLITDKLESPVKLGLLVVKCSNLSSADKAMEIVKKMSDFSRIKNKTVTDNGCEIIFEFKSKKEKELEYALMESEYVECFSYINYDRENRY
jgi:uncharacterized membrane protein YhiD involved in acid resistance